MRKLKAVGLALVAVGALGAVTATSASANYNIASATGGTFSGKQVQASEWNTNLGPVKCTGATFSAAQASETAETLTVLPAYSGCTLAGVKMNITTEKCHYLFTKPTMTPESSGITTHAVMHVKCPTAGTNAFILIKDTSGAGCELKIGEQETKGVAEMTDEAAGTIFMGLMVEGISYSWTSACPNAGGKAGSDTEGTYSVTTHLEGKNTSGTTVGVKAT